MTKKAWVYIILETLLFITLLFSVVTCNGNKIDILENNIDAYKGKIEYIELENKELLSTKQSLILSETALRDELDITKQELKTLNKKLGDKVSYISRLESQIGIKDTIILEPDTVYLYNEYTVKKFTWSDEWTYLNASVCGSNIASSSLSIDNFKMNLSLDVGLTDDYKFWVKTSNPYVTFTNINSAILEGSQLNKKEKRLHHGVTLGMGLNYGLISKSLDIGPSLIYGFTYSF